MGIFKKKKSKEQSKPTDLSGKVPKKTIPTVEVAKDSLETGKKQPANMDEVLQLLVDHINQSEEISQEFYSTFSTIINATNTSAVTKLGVLSLISHEIATNVFRK